MTERSTTEGGAQPEDGRVAVICDAFELRDTADIFREAAKVAGECAEELRAIGGEMATDREYGAAYASQALLRLADEAEAKAEAEATVADEEQRELRAELAKVAR